MKKLRSILAVAVTLGLVLLCAGLPNFSALLIRQKTGKTPVYKDIPPVELDFNQEEKPLSMLAKLSLYLNGQRVDVKPANATRTEEEIETRVKAFLSQCEQAGVHGSFQHPRPSVSTQVVYDVSNPAKSMIVWRYSGVALGPLKADNSQSYEMHVLDVTVDDESGRILAITLNHYNVSYSENGIWSRNRKRVEALTDLYFAQLGLTQMAELAEASPDKLYEYMEVDMGVTEVYYTILDPDCGALKILFLVGGVDTFRIMPTNTK